MNSQMTENISGVLRTKPLLCLANEAGAFGKTVNYPGGFVGYALFVFLGGIPDYSYDLSLFRGRPLVCLSDEWENFILEKFPDVPRYRRWHMHPRWDFDFSKVRLPDAGYEIRPFGAEEFERHPFGHGENYADYAGFMEKGSGAAAYLGDEIVSAASSFLSLDREVELDVSTKPEHRRKHLAENCVAVMLRDCAERGIVVHWDAQNIESKVMAEKFGFEVDQEYTVYVPRTDN